MTKITQYFYRAEHKLDTAAEGFFFYHPYLGLFTVFIGMPILVLSAVTISTIVVMLPFAFLLGWF